MKFQTENNVLDKQLVNSYQQQDIRSFIQYYVHVSNIQVFYRKG
jgi:hypothetical protein